MRQIIKHSFIKSLPVMAGYLVLGFGFGIISEKSGYGFIWVLAMSTFIYAGSMQYVTISLLTGGATLISAALTTLMVNARHLFYGITMIEPYKKTGLFKPYLIFGLTDETYSLVCNGETPDNVDFTKYAFFVSLFNQIYWIVGSILGAIIGNLIKINFMGIEFAMTALFITVLVDQWRKTKNHFPSIIGLVTSIICLIIFGKENFLIPSMLIISLVLWLTSELNKKKEVKNNE
ncbi:MAG: AzlC family ABC transporter permease [Bacilli bacterium]|nr:AzlC family ABC transporter permease [Bacilli bacterium]